MVFFDSNLNPLVLLPLIIIFIYLSYGQYIGWKNNRKHQQRIQWQLAFLHQIKSLIQFLPQHRGVANVYLRGNHNQKQNILKLQYDLNQCFDSLDQHCDKQRAPLSNSELSIIHCQWIELRDNLFELTPEVSFTHHTNIIRDVLELIENTSEKCLIHRDLNQQTSPIYKAVIRALPELIEILGQARGIGTGVITQGNIPVAAKLKLVFLYTRGKQALNEVFGPLKGSKNTYLKEQQNLLAESANRSEQFFQILDTQLLNASTIDIKADDYFATASQAIEIDIQLFEEFIRVVERSIIKKA